MGRKRIVLSLSAGIIALVLVAGLFTVSQRAADIVQQRSQEQLSEALYEQVDFFGTRARVARPTEAARTRLQALAEKFPDNSEIRIKLAQVCEELEDFTAAEKHMKAAVEI
ncbi:MAG: tetratricopeptide repeat protein, partial [Acidobacteriota bacterium]